MANSLDITKSVSLNIRNKTRISTFITFIQNSTASSSHRNQRRRYKSHTNLKAINKTVIICDDMILYTDNLKIHQVTTGTDKGIQEGSRIQTNI